MKVKRKIIQIDEELCDGCGQCVPACAEGTLEIIDGKAKVVSDNLCDGLGACLGECPNGALEIVEREAEEFDEVAVGKRISEIKPSAEPHAKDTMPCGCPSSNIMTFGTKSPCESTPFGADEKPVDSELTHWPVKIRLIPPDAPFLNGADILILADCVPAAYSNLHQSLIKGRKVMMGCPKFDDPQSYIEKLESVFRRCDINSITTVTMEVPCCSGLNTIVRKSLSASGKDIPVTEVIIDRKGCILEHRKVA